MLPKLEDKMHWEMFWMGELENLDQETFLKKVENGKNKSKLIKKKVNKQKKRSQKVRRRSQWRNERVWLHDKYDSSSFHNVRGELS